MKRQNALPVFFAMLITSSLACSLPGQSTSSDAPTATASRQITASPVNPTRAAYIQTLNAPTPTPLAPINVKLGEVAKVGTIQIAVLQWDFAAPNAQGKINGINATVVVAADRQINVTSRIGVYVTDESGTQYVNTRGFGWQKQVTERMTTQMFFENLNFPLDKAAKLKMIFDVKGVGGTTITVDLGAPGKTAFPAVAAPVIVALGETKNFGAFALTVNGLEVKEKPSFTNKNVITVIVVDLTLDAPATIEHPLIFLGFADDNWTFPGNYRVQALFQRNPQGEVFPLKQRSKFSIEYEHPKTETALKRVLISTGAGIIGVAVP